MISHSMVFTCVKKKTTEESFSQKALILAHLNSIDQSIIYHKSYLDIDDVILLLRDAPPTLSI